MSGNKYCVSRPSHPQSLQGYINHQCFLWQRAGQPGCWCCFPRFSRRWVKGNQRQLLSPDSAENPGSILLSGFRRSNEKRQAKESIFAEGEAVSYKADRVSPTCRVASPETAKVKFTRTSLHTQSDTHICLLAGAEFLSFCGGRNLSSCCTC